MAGYLPLTWECVDAWMRATGAPVYAHEARALVMLDAVLCFPGEDE